MEEFIAWLRKSNADLAQLVAVFRAYGEFTTTAGAGRPAGTEPGKWAPGQTVTLTTVPLADKELDELGLGLAEAVVVEKAIEYVKGFVAGVMIAA